jgi:hypothetical protein
MPLKQKTGSYISKLAKADIMVAKEHTPGPGVLILSIIFLGLRGTNVN